MTRGADGTALGGLVLRTTTVAWFVVVCMSVPQRLGAAPNQFPRFSVVESTVKRHFERTKDRRSDDLISRADVEPIFAQLESQGWEVSDRSQILSEVLSDGDFLVRTMRSRDGVRFMRQVSGNKLIYDRLDRIAHESGGQRLIRDLIKLPDAARYAKLDPQRGVPGMLEFLPKNRSGKSRQVENYRKPTGQIYTQEQLLQRLRLSYAEDSR